MNVYQYYKADPKLQKLREQVPNQMQHALVRYHLYQERLLSRRIAKKKKKKSSGSAACKTNFFVRKRRRVVLGSGLAVRYRDVPK